MIFPKHQFLTFFVAATAVFTAFGSAQARPSVEFVLGGDNAIPGNTVGILVADRAGNGFQALTHSSVVGTELTAGEAVGLSDDLILHVFRSGSEGFDSGNGFASLIPNLKMAHWQLDSQTPLAFYWFGGISNRGQMLAANDDFASLLLSEKLDFPQNRGLFTIAVLTPANGGSADVAGNRTVGKVGEDPTNQGENDQINIPGTPFEDAELTDVGFSDPQRGRYVGLVQGADTRIHGEVGLTVGKDGAASFLVVIDGRAAKLRGTFDPATGLFSTVVIRGVAYTFQLSQSADGNFFVTGTAEENGSTFLIGAVQQALPGQFDSDKISGRYTVVLPADADANSAILPGGNGHAMVTVSSKGSIKATMILGDGSVASDSTFLGRGNSWLLFLPLYRGKGFIAGELRFRKENNVSDVDGSLHWRKGQNPKDRRYSMGFETAVHAVGSKYRAPWADERGLTQLADSDSNATWNWGWSDDTQVEQTFTWAGRNKLEGPSEAFVTVPNEPLLDGVLKLRQAFVSKTGQIVGSVEVPSFAVAIPPVNGRPPKPESARFYGVVLQKQGIVAGVVRRTSFTQDFVIEPVGGPSLMVTDAGGNPLATGDTVDFGDIGVGGGIGERVLEIGNAGNANLYLGENPAISPEAYSLEVWRRGYLAPGETALIRVRVDPEAIGAAPGELIISSNDPANNPFNLTLATNGVAGDQSDVDSETGGNTSLTLPAEFEAAEFSDADFLPENDAGRYGGAILSAGGGNASLLISESGAFSGRIKIGINYANVRGTMGADGFGTASYFKGRLAATHQISAIELLENPDGANAILINLVSPEGDEAVLLQHQNFGKTNRTTKAGKYTFVLPNTEDLGAGYPSGDGAGVLSIDRYGIVRAKLRLADRQSRSLTGRLASDESWSFSQRWTLGILTGKVHLTESAEADFQGSASYQRLAHPRVTLFPRGFAIQNSILGSRFAAVKGENLLALEATTGNALLSLAGDLTNPIAGMPLNWTPSGRIAVETRASGESIRFTVSRTSGWVTGTSSIQGEKSAFSGVAFQKQNLVTGSWGSGDKVGAFLITPILGSK